MKTLSETGILERHPPFRSCQPDISPTSCAEEWWNQSSLCNRAKEMSSFLFCLPDAAWRKLILSLSFLFSQKCSLSTAKESSSISSSGDNTPENLTTPSSSIDQRTLPQSADKLTLLSAENSSILKSAEKTSPATPSSSVEQNSTAKQSNSSVKTVNDLLSCIPGPSSAILSGPSECHSRPPTSSPIQLSQSTTSCNAAPDSATIEITPTTLADAICDSGTNVEGSCVVKTITESPPSDRSPPSGSYACQPTCVSGRSR